MARTGHKSTYPGRRVYVRMKDGTAFVDRFVEDRDDVIVFRGAGRVLARKIATVGDYRPRSGVQDA